MLYSRLFANQFCTQAGFAVADKKYSSFFNFRVQLVYWCFCQVKCKSKLTANWRRTDHDQANRTDRQQLQSVYVRELKFADADK